MNAVYPEIQLFIHLLFVYYTLHTHIIVCTRWDLPLFTCMGVPP